MRNLEPTICEFNPDVDFCEVDPFGYVNLVDAFVNGVVPANCDIKPEGFNGIEEPENIGGKPRDAFDVMRVEKTLNTKVKKATAKADKPA